jgi:hypothetical protein
MNTIFCLAVAVQLSYVGQSVHADILPQSIHDLEATTQSVVKRRVGLNGTIAFGPEAPIGNSPLPAAEAFPDASGDQVVQASFQKTENTKSADPRSARQSATPNSASQIRKNATADASPNSAANRTTAGSAAGSEGDPTTSTGSVSSASLDPATRAAGNASADLLASALTAPDEDGLEGRPLPLAEALGRGTAGRQRLEAASLYWRLALAIADYHWAVDELRQLESLPANAGAVDPPLFATARASANSKVLEARAAAITAQQELADSLGQPTSAMPLVVEQPLVGAYRTHFDTIFAGRSAPGRSRAIDRALPLWREAIDLRTAAVQAATSGVQAAEEAYGKGNAAAETVLYAHRELSQQRRAFLSAVREYNAEIVEYASYVAGPNTSTATIVSMLTRPKPIRLDEAGASAPGSPHEPTLANPQLDPEVRRASGAQDFRDGDWRADDVGQADAGADDNAGAAKPETQLKAIDGGR